MKKKGLHLFLVAGLALVGMSAISNNYASADGQYSIDYHNEYRFGILMIVHILLKMD
ncbi:hypothetical protein [Bacillus sp. FDAARGOS_527]|uniref:hypothetical protein n=1 Tax=Bacillus sp. FDAARGOS_527 TaxID=2576356 RepID=UPI001D027EC0|nr:hypothetical protein [Bacillus sp. FDAARGOS_527]